MCSALASLVNPIFSRLLVHSHLNHLGSLGTAIKDRADIYLNNRKKIVVMAEKHILAPATMERLIRKAGAKRVSEDAKHALLEHLESVSEEVCRNAVKIASFSGRRTVKGEDIEKVIGQKKE